MEMEKIESLLAIVKQLYKDMKDIAGKHPDQPIRWDTAEIFNDLLVQAKQQMKDHPVIKQIQALERPRDDESCRALKVVDMVAKLSVLKGALMDCRMTHELRQYELKQR